MKKLKAGPILLGYENGFLRRLSYGEHEVLRMIYFALRDHNWITINSTIREERIREGNDHFQVTYVRDEIFGESTVMTWDVRIEGKSDGTVVFAIAGEMLTDFSRNRAGFCVLHPLSVAGTECVLHHEDDSRSVMRFPEEIAPDDPFTHIKSMEWTISGTAFQLDFEGDLFETEDQRNWGDASFKTFCTPLDVPFPVTLTRGQKISQRIVFRPRQPLASLPAPSGPVVLRPLDLPRIVPALGLAASTQQAVPPTSVVSQLRAGRFNHYRADVAPSDETWVRTFSNACEEAASLGYPLEIALHLSDNEDEEIEAFLMLCQQNRVRPRRVLVLSQGALVTKPRALDAIQRLRNGLRNARIGAGTDFNFTEINRNRFDGRCADFISFSFSPQEHASDDLTLLENTETPAHMVRSAKTIFGPDVPVHISPVVLKRRYNPYAKDPADWPIALKDQVDPRLGGNFGAVWTFAALCSFIRGGASAITLFQTWGDLGIISADGQTRPVFETLKAFAAFQGKGAIIMESTDPLAVQGVLLDGKVLAMANLSQEEKSVSWENKTLRLEPRSVRYEKLDRSEHA